MSRIWVGMEGRPHISTNNTICLFWFRTLPPPPLIPLVCKSAQWTASSPLTKSTGNLEKKLVEGELGENERRHWKKIPWITIYKVSSTKVYLVSWETWTASLPSLNFGNALLNVTFSAGQGNIYLSRKKSTSSNWLEMLNYVQFVAINL